MLKNTMKQFGLDANKKDFWQQGLNIIADYLDEAEELAEKLKY
jgi:oligoendopeptidase F